MRIYVIGPTHPYRGGISHYNTLLCKHLMNIFDVKLITFKRLYPTCLFPGKNQRDLESREKIEIESEFALDSINPLTWLKMVSEIKREKPDMLILHWWTPFFAPLSFTLSFLTKKLTNTKILFICHNVLPHETRYLDKILTKIALKYSDFYIVHSSEDYNKLNNLIPGSNVTRMFLPTYEIFKFERISREDAKRRLNLKKDVILYFGFIREYKGLKILLRSMQAVLEKNDVDLLVVGEFWHDKNIYLEEIDILGIGKNVIIVDKYIPNEEVGLYFSAADVVVLPYISASQSGIIQIAYGFNRPVITTDVGGLPDVVEDGVTGFIVPARNSKALSDSIIRYFDGTYEKRFEENIKNMKNIYSWEKFVDLIGKFLIDRAS